MTSRNVTSFDNRISQLKRQLESIKDQRKSELSLDFRAAHKSEAQDGLQAGQPDEDDGQDISVGLNFKKMLGNKSAKGEYQKLQFQIQQIELEKRYAQMELDANITNLHIQLTEMKNILKLNKVLVDTAQQTTKEESKIYHQGRSDLTNVISSRDQMQNTRLQYAKNAVSYQKLYLQLLSLSDLLLNNSKGKE